MLGLEMYNTFESTSPLLVLDPITSAVRRGGKENELIKPARARANGSNSPSPASPTAQKRKKDPVGDGKGNKCR
jgi:hypothetical protein